MLSKIWNKYSQEIHLTIKGLDLFLSTWKIYLLNGLNIGGINMDTIFGDDMAKNISLLNGKNTLLGIE